MSLIYVKAKNYKNHESIDFNMDGKSIMLLGDSGVGKSNFMNLVLAHLGVIPYPDDAQKKGTDSGWTETKMEIGGVEYVIKREFENNKLKRFRMTADGRKVTWEDTITHIFNGLSPATSFFDYNKFFFQLRSSDKRFEYLVQCSIGQKFFSNKKLIDENIDERGNIGTQRRMFESRLMTSDLNEANYQSLLEKFEKPHPTTEAEAEKEKILSQRKSSQELVSELNAIKEANRLTQIAEEKKKEFEEGVASIEEKIKQLIAEKDKLQTGIERCNQRINEHPINKEKEMLLVASLDTLEQDNLKIEQEANVVYLDKMKDVEVFNTQREKFFNDKKDLDEFLRLDAEWHKLDDEIKSIRQENVSLFKEKLPVEGLEIKETLSKPADPNSKTSYELWWKGKEVSFETLAKGETLEFALLVQNALSPSDLKLIFIPEGQSMGSRLDDMLEVAKRFGIQTVVEITERKHQFEIKFEEQYLDK